MTIWTRGVSERGQVLPLVAAVGVVIVAGAAALVYDLGSAYQLHQKAQAAADAAALAGAYDLPGNPGLARSDAQAYATQNVPGSTATIQTPYSSDSGQISVKVAASRPPIFAGFFGLKFLQTSATAVARRGPSATGSCTLGYPYSSANPRTSVTFAESDVLRGFSLGPGHTIIAWYDDEHALTLGVRQETTKTSGGSTTQDYPVTPDAASPSSATDPAVGDLAAVDPTGRPMFPALFITDITNDPNNRSGDWEFDGTPIPPSAVFGTWKTAVETTDQTRSPASVSVTPDRDPAKNGWNLGAGSDAAPSGLRDEGYGAEVRWDLDKLGLQSDHVYRFEFEVHDGDQNKAGGDAGEACLAFSVGTAGTAMLIK
jgi:hypothetical protein